MKIIIAGDGKVGLTLTQKLSAEGHDLTLIDSNQKVLDSSVERYDVMGVQGNCASMRVLESADVRKADLLIAATSADEINLLCCMTAHGLNPKIHTIARIRNPEYGKQIFTMRDVYSLSLMVNPEKQAAREIERLIKYPGFLQRDTFAKSRVEIVELRIDEGSKLCNVALNDLDSITKCKVLVCAVSRKGVAQIPDGHFVLQEGDRVFVTAPSENLTILLKNLGVITHKAKRVIICGGGRIGYYLAERLARNGVTVQLIEQDEDRCVELSDKLPKEVCVIHGDASSQFLLESEGVSDCDALVSMTGIDEMNMIISLYAKNCGVPQVITKVGHMEIHNIHDTLGLGSVVCPKELCCNNIVRYVRAMQNTAGAALTLHNIAEGQAEALESVVDEKTRYIGTPLRDMKTKANVLIVCISHGSKTEIPNFLDALFEIVSGFTTTGASVLSNVEGLSKGILYWRSFSHWLGGMGVLVFLLAVGERGDKGSGFTLHLLRAESPGPTCNFGIFSWFSKLILIFDMLAGRLEIFPMLILVNRSTWRRR